MTLTQSLLGFGVLATLMAITPGLDTIFVLRQALRGSRAGAFAAVTGICLGTLIWGVAAAAGVAALFVASQVAFAALRWAGIAFLVWLAVGYLRQAWRGPGVETEPEESTTSVAQSFVKGLVTNLSNPKIAVFYLSVLPVFLPVGYPPPLAGALLAAVHVTVGMAWFVVVIFAARSVRGFLNSRRGVRVTDGVAGVAMLGFAVALGVER